MTPEEVIAELKSPGRLTIFLDDSGTPGKQLETLATDTQFVCAVALKSEDYVHAHDTLDDYLTCVGVRRFHATEIVNPKTESEWKGQTNEKRVEALQFLYSTLEQTSSEFFWCPINSEQFNGTRDDGIHIRKSIKEKHGKDIKQKASLWEVMQNAVITYFSDWADGRLAIVCEDEKGKDDIRVSRVGESQLVLDGIIYAKKSARIHGLELADAAAYLLNRCHWTAANSNHNPFDVAIAEAWDTLRPRFRNVLNEPTK